jgi:hypothetical protein
MTETPGAKDGGGIVHIGGDGGRVVVGCYIAVASRFAPLCLSADTGVYGWMNGCVGSPQVVDSLFWLAYMQDDVPKGSFNRTPILHPSSP